MKLRVSPDNGNCPLSVLAVARQANQVDSGRESPPGPQYQCVRTGSQSTDLPSFEAPPRHVEQLEARRRSAGQLDASLGSSTTGRSAPQVIGIAPGPASSILTL